MYFHELEYYDKEIWDKLIFDITHKKFISNIYFWSTFYETLTVMNKDPKNPYF